MKSRSWILILAPACVVDGSLGNDAIGDADAGDARQHVDSGSDSAHDAGSLDHAIAHGGGGAGGATALAGGSGGLHSDTDGRGAAAHGGANGGTPAHAGAGGHLQGGEPAAVDAGSPAACEMAPSDDECTSCQKHSCCGDFAQCAEHAPCICVSECLAPGVSVGACETHCEISAFPEIDALTSCAIAHCSDACN